MWGTLSPTPRANPERGGSGGRERKGSRGGGEGRGAVSREVPASTRGGGVTICDLTWFPGRKARALGAKGGGMCERGTACDCM